MPILPYLTHAPQLGAQTAPADSAYVVGKVTMAGPARLESSAVLRGDSDQIQIGARFRMGAGSSIHTDRGSPARVGEDVWLGADVTVHACTVGDGVRVEDGSRVLSGSAVGAGSIVAAHSLVPEGVSFPADSYISGTPGRRERDTTAEERAATVAQIAAVLAADA